VAVAEPGREMALRPRLCGEGPDPEAGDLQAVPVVIEPAQRLAERLAHPVVAVRTYRVLRRQRLTDRMEAGDVVAGGEDESPAPFQASGLEDVVGAPEVDVEDRLEGSVVDDGGQVHDGLAAGRRPACVLQVPDVTGDGLFARRRVQPLEV